MRKLVTLTIALMGTVTLAQDAHELPPRSRAIQSSQNTRLVAVSGVYPLESTRLSGHAGATRVSPDGRWAIAATVGSGIDSPDPHHRSGLRLYGLADDSVATLGSRLSAITSIALTSSRAITGHDDGTIRVIAIPSGSVEHVLDFKAGGTAIALSGDGGTIFSASNEDGAGGSYEAVLREWDVASGACRHVLARLSREYVATIAVSPDGKTLALGTNTVVLVLDVATAKTIHTIDPQPGEPRRDCPESVEFSADGTRLAIGSWGGLLLLVDTASWETFWRVPLALESKEADVRALAFSPDGKRLLVAANGIGLVDVADGKVAAILTHGGRESAAAFTPDGSSALLGTSHGLELFDLARGISVRQREGHSAPIVALAATRDGRALFTGADDRTLKVWDAQGRIARTLRWPGMALESLAASRDLKLAVGGRHAQSDFCGFDTHYDRTDTIAFFDLGRGVEIEPGERYEGDIDAVAISEDGSLAVSAGAEVIAWSLPQGKRLRLLSAPAAKSEDQEGTHETVVAISPDGKSVLTGDAAGTLRLRALETGKLLVSREGHEGHVFSIAFSPEGDRVLTAGGDGKLVLRDARTLAPVWTVPFGEHPDDDNDVFSYPLPFLRSATFSPDGGRLAVIFENVIELRDAKTGRALDEIDVGPSRDRPTAVALIDGGVVVTTLEGVVLRFATRP
jgi:WD40 repeat protein